MLPRLLGYRLQNGWIFVFLVPTYINVMDGKFYICTVNIELSRSLFESIIIFYLFFN